MGNQPSVETNYVMYVFLLVALYGLCVVYGNACIAVKSESGTRQSVSRMFRNLSQYSGYINCSAIYMYPTLLAGRLSVYPLGAHL